MAKQESCYYSEYDMCTNPGSDFHGKRCPAATCERYISESDYFLRTMNGEVIETTRVVTEDPKVRDAKIKSALSLGKSKKQLKYEERKKQEAEGFKKGDGYTLKDDPRFKDLFK